MINKEIIGKFKYLFGNNSKPCFLIGNGINRYPNNPKERSWIGLLTDIRNTFEQHKCNLLSRPYKRLDQIPEGISLTEFYETIYSKNGIVDISGKVWSEITIVRISEIIRFNQDYFFIINIFHKFIE